MFKLQEIHVKIIVKGMAVQLSAFSITNGSWILEDKGGVRSGLLPDFIIKCDNSFSIGVINNEELKEDCRAGIDVYDCSLSPQIIIGKIMLSISVKRSNSYDWIPLCDGYVAQLENLFHPPVTFRIIKSPRTVGLNAARS